MRSHDRQIWQLAVPAFLTLVTEPLFLLADSAIIGHVGTRELAGLGVAGVILQTLVGLCVFLAYGTTAAVARSLGAGDRRAAVAQGVDGLWLAAIIGTLVTIPVAVGADPLVRSLGAGGALTAPATTYLQIAVLGTTPLLLMLAATGVLRGFWDTRTPLIVAVAANLLNVVLNFVLVFGFGWGIAGSAIGSVVAQSLAAVALVGTVAAKARREQASLRPHRAGIRRAAHSAVPLVVRTLTLRLALLVTVYAVGRLSADTEVELAAHQLAMTIWTFLAFTLDALAIAAQAITGRWLGAGDRATARALTRRLIGWGVVVGVGTGVLLAALSPVLPGLFTDDPAVVDAVFVLLLVIAVGQPICGVVFVLDGVLIGAGDGRYLAWAMLACLAVYLPCLVLAPSLVWVWIAFSAVFMGARCVVLVQRERTDAWLVLGAAR
ncbi:MAG: MATE family efflux transporter [Mycobacterium sp.]